jgi:hypothetical protein
MVRRLLLVFLAVSASPARSGLVHEVPGAHPTIGSALTVSVSGDTVRVAAGTWAPSLTGESFPLSVPDGVTLLGAGRGNSVIDAERTGRVIELTGPGSSRVSGFTLRGGVADRGGGVHIVAGTHEVDSLLITECGALVRGSAVNVEGDAQPLVHHNILWECYDNDLQDPGDPHVAQWGGTASGSFAHNLVGRGDSNGLFVFENAAPEVRHNIFVENGIEGVRGRGICFAGDDATVIAHNLFWANSVAALIMRDASGNFVNVDAATANAISPTDGVYGNLDADPLLVDPDAMVFSLQPTSPAIDAGEPGTGTDPDGTVLDLGPIHYQDPVVSNPPTPGIRLARLGPARPNPFNPQTELELHLDRPGFVEIGIYDARGRKVRRLMAGPRDAGRHTVRFDGLDDAGRALPSGVYFAHLRALGSSSSTPMALVR